MSMILKQGNEYVYKKTGTAEAIWLTYVKKIKSEEKHLLFSSEFPTTDYHLPEECLDVGDPKENPYPQIAEEYLAFSGKDVDKKKAYDILWNRRGQKTD